MPDNRRPGPRPVIVYDGDCAYCRRQMARIRDRDRSEIFEYQPRQAAVLLDRFPALATGEFDAGMRLIDPDGTIHIGADAVYEIAKRLPRWRKLAWAYRVPGLHGLARLAYRWIAANRHRIAGDCDDGACDAATPAGRVDL